LSARFTSLETYDIRFPTSRDRDGSDAVNPDPDYSAAYVILRTDDPGGPAGHGFAFTIGRGRACGRADRHRDGRTRGEPRNVQTAPAVGGLPYRFVIALFAC